MSRLSKMDKVYIMTKVIKTILSIVKNLIDLFS